MRRVGTAALIPGMVTAEDVFNYNGNLILPKGLILTDKTITKLEFYSIVNVRVEDDVVKMPEEEIQAEDSYSERLKSSPEFKRFQKEFEKETDSFRQSVNDIVEQNVNMDVDQLVNHALTLLSDDGNYVNVFDMLHCMRQYDDATYVHCMNVALICNVFARWLRMQDDEIRLATVCGLLHDIGKLKMPERILKKPGRLTDWEYNVIQTHPREGYHILQTLPIDEHIKNVALMHHERCDGTGYPLGLSAGRIDPYAKLVAIADVYDAMTCARVYRGPLCPFKVISIFESEGLQKYDTRYIMTFLENIVDTYLLHRVRLTNGEEGKIVYINTNKLSKPTVKIGSSYLNLSEEPHLAIDAII